MRSLVFTIVFLTLATSAVQVPAGSTTSTSQAGETGRSCGPIGTAHVRTTLYFGLNRPTGAVSEGEWRTFLRDHVTPRFPDGLTVWEANGQWRRANGSIARERAKVLLVVHDETAAARDALGVIVANYKRAFQQESVLWESAPVCATF